jgi:phasin family protein
MLHRNSVADAANQPPNLRTRTMRARTDPEKNLMFTTPAQFTAFQKTNADAITAYGQALFNAAERLTQLQLATARAFLSDSASAVQGMAGVKDQQGLMAMTQGSAQPAIEKMVNYSRSLYSIASGVGAELSKIAEAQISDGNRRVAEFIDTAAKNAPAGSEPAVAWIKNAVAASNSAYDSMNRAAQQAVETGESNLAAAGEAVKQKTPRKVA